MNRPIALGARVLAVACLLSVLAGCSLLRDNVIASGPPDGLGKGAGTVTNVDTDHNTFDCACSLLSWSGSAPPPPQAVYRYSTVGATFLTVAPDGSGITPTSIYYLGPGDRVIVTSLRNAPSVATMVVIQH